MLVKQVVFPRANEVQLEEVDVDLTPSENEIVIRTLASIISAGTELACLSGSADWAPFPFRPGYGAVGEVIAVGKNVKDVKVGEIILTNSNHSSHAKAKVAAIKVPDGLEPQKAVFARMANVSITALRVSSAELGDKVAVIGLGLVGNLAAQLFQISGCQVVGIDKVKKRLEVAKECGIEKVINSEEIDPVQGVMELTVGKGCEVVVDATGNPAATLFAPKLASKYGEVILLGSYFGRKLETNVTELLEQIHLSGYGCITFKGAHEWRYPVKEFRDDIMPIERNAQFYKHSYERNAKINLSLIAEGKLKIEPLITHIVKPEKCAEVYFGLRYKPSEYIGVVFDWT
ncbi:MAG: zinc-binding alcohol dehydrogenase [Armatimonadetes bacterium]|nr:zinc-binding alcohol dehydrogenase [Armatimonadota bacterium]MDW8029236.1 zinc-binding alcohol dehydrogenase [Armatimonadota bacterium]